MNEEQVQGEFAQVAEMTQAEKEKQFAILRDGINSEIARFGINDFEINEAILAFVKSISWLKSDHKGEGSVHYSFKKKKNIRDAATATIAVEAKYKQVVSETRSNTITEIFLEKTFNTVKE